MRAAAVLLVPLLLVPGCIFSPGQDDLTYVCEKKAGAAGPAYSVDGLEAFTTVRDANLTAQDARELFAAIQPWVITGAQAHHANFSATLDKAGDGWRFEGVGRNASGGVVDTYSFDLARAEGKVEITATRPTVEAVPVPESLVTKAWDVVNKTPELDQLANRTPTLVATGWSKDIPACVRLLFQDGPADAILPVSPEHPHTVVVVSLVSDRVVFLQKPGWNGNG